MSRPLTMIIVDDEPLARKGLQVRLQAHNDLELVAQCANGRQAIEAVQRYQPDLMFLDIQMPGLNGFQVVQSLIELEATLPVVVFVTAFDQYAIKAFEVHALDYLLKPVDEVRLAQTLDKVRQHQQSQQDSLHKSQLVRLVSDVTGNDSKRILDGLDGNTSINLTVYSDVLSIKDGSEVSRVAVNSILWIDAAGDYMCVHTEKNTHILRKTMKQLEAFLDPRQFIRSHRSTIINREYIDKFCNNVNGESYLVLKNTKQLKVSRSYKDKVKQVMRN
jgi:two-component system LytT family response regulator